MAPSPSVEAVSAFIHGAPPGELTDVINDFKALTTNEPSLLQHAQQALEKYNEEQLTCVKLPGGSQSVIISQYNRLDDGRYYDLDSRTSWQFDHVTQKASNAQSYSAESQNLDTISSLHKAFSIHASEHYPSSTIAVLPTSNDTTIALLLAANKYSPSNFWSGRFRCTYIYDPSSYTLSGTIRVDVHYYEDGNVRLTTTKTIPETKIPSGKAGEVVRELGKVTKKYHEDLNRGFMELNEGGFKGLRRPLPVTRQKMEWEKVSSYRAGRDIGGGKR